MEANRVLDFIEVGGRQFLSTATAGTRSMSRAKPTVAAPSLGMRVTGQAAFLRRTGLPGQGYLAGHLTPPSGP